jgi:hypothetical protein
MKRAARFIACLLLLPACARAGSLRDVARSPSAVSPPVCTEERLTATETDRGMSFKPAPSPAPSTLGLLQACNLASSEEQGVPGSISVSFGLMTWLEHGLSDTPVYRVVFHGGQCIRIHGPYSGKAVPSCGPNQDFAVVLEAVTGGIIVGYASEE